MKNSYKSYKITKADIDAAEAHDVCEPAIITWLRAAQRTIEDLCNHSKYWAFTVALYHPSLPDEARAELYKLTKCISYWSYGKRHRSGGPAIVLERGTKMYYKNGVQYFPNK